MAEAKVIETKQRDKAPAYDKAPKGKKFLNGSACDIHCVWGEDAYLNVATLRYPPAQQFGDYAHYVDAVERFAVALTEWVAEARAAMPEDRAKRAKWVAEKRKEVRDKAAAERAVESGAIGDLLTQDEGLAESLIGGMSEEQRNLLLAALTAAGNDSQE